MDLKEVKKEFLSFRNGIVADALRKGGIPHKYIFGLQLPQIREIAARAGEDSGLARTLWEDSDCRESRLLAPFLFKQEELAEEEALVMIQETRCQEELDILVFGLMRHLPYFKNLHERLIGDHPRQATLSRFL